MRKVKSTALLSAFVAVASLGAISHEAHGTTIQTSGTTFISKEMLPNSSASFQASIIPNVSFSGSSITLTISGASFLSGQSYTISGAGTTCTAIATSSGTLTFSSCTVSAFNAYPIIGPSLGSYFSVSVPPSSSSIVLSYSSSVPGDATSTTIADVQPQLSFAPISSSTYYINPGSQSLFTNNSSSSASNSVVLSNSAYSNSTWSNTITPSITMSFVFTGIPSSVNSVSLGTSSSTPVNGSVTVNTTLTATGSGASAPFKSASSDTITFTFSNSSNAPISTGTISLSSIVGQVTGSSTSYVYLSTPQTFLTFTLGATQIYVPDALANYGGNLIQAGFITISMPSDTSIASISVLNIPGASCPVPTIANGSLSSASTTGVYYIDLNKLAKLCTGINPIAWQAGVPLVITLSGPGVGPNTVTADAYAVFNGYLKRIPVNVVAGNAQSFFSY